MAIIRPPMPRMITPSGSPSISGGFWSIGLHELGRDDHEDADQADRQEADHVARHAPLRGEGLDLALDAHALADGEGDGVQDLGEVAADLVLDGDGRGHQLQVVGLARGGPCC